MVRSRAVSRPSSRVRAAAPAATGGPWWAGLLVAVTGLAVYANSLGGPFLFDDQKTIVENPSIRQLFSLGALQPPPGTPVSGRPFANLSFAVSHAVSGLAPWGYHAANVLIHVLAALVLLAVLRRTFARTPGIGGESGLSSALALAGALLWVVHPLNTESVTYITQRTELLMGLCYLLAVYASIRALEPGRAARWEAAAGLAAVLGAATKESLITIPVVIALWDRAYAFESLGEMWRARRRLYAALALSWVVFLIEAPAAPFFGRVGFTERVSVWTYLQNQGPVIATYLKLAFWPHGLIFDYGATEAVRLADVWPGLALVAVLLLLAAVAVARAPKQGFWAAWFFITLSPASSVVPIPTEVGAERRMYLPLIGLIALVLIGAAEIRRRMARPRPLVGWGVAGVAVVALGVATVARNGDYQDGLTLWQTVLDRRPQPRAHEHVSMYLRDAGRVDEAIAHLRAAAPSLPNARHALASALLERGDTGGAIAEFREFIRLHPDDPQLPSARAELAEALARSGDADGAAEQYQAILRGQPASLGALVNLASVRASQGRMDEAVVLLRRATAAAPRDVGVRRPLVRLLARQRDLAGVETEARALLAAVPDDVEAHDLLGVALASMGRVAEARDEFAAAVRLDPSNRDARVNLDRATELLRGASAPR